MEPLESKWECKSLNLIRLTYKPNYPILAKLDNIDRFNFPVNFKDLFPCKKS